MAVLIVLLGIAGYGMLKALDIIPTIETESVQNEQR